MNRQGRVLVIDDLERWREQLVETLQRNGFYADSATTTKEALDRLNGSFYHLLILDVRLVDADPNNQDGIDLLAELERRGLSDAVKVIILSAYRTQERMRTAFKDHRVADFLSKDEFSSRILLDSVQHIFTKEIHINLALDMLWQHMSGPEQAVLNLEVGETRVRRNTSLQGQIGNELEDLLCRLFYRSKSVMMHSMTSGKSPTGVLWAQPFYSSGGGARAVVIKFGDFRNIDKERHNFKEYVEPFIGGGRSTAILDVQRTLRLGGIMYTFLGTNNDRLEDFGSFYPHASVPQIQSVLDNLFFDTCRAWYANMSHLQPHNLTSEYQDMFGFTPEKLEHALGELQKYVQGKQRLTFKDLSCDQTFTNPLLALTGPSFICSTYICTTHGDFNQHNLLIDADHTWLIDFQSTGPGHILRDVAQLDSEIRFLLLGPDEATLNERLEMEEALCSAERFDHVEPLAYKFSTQNAALAKTYATIIHLRSLAHKLVAQNPSNALSEYYIALFYNAVNTIRFYALPTIQREHALLCASLLADKLGLKG